MIDKVFKNTEMSNAMEVEDPKVIKIAKLAMIVADPKVELKDKYICIKIAIKQGTITEEEGAIFIAYRPELTDFADVDTGV